MKTYTIAPNALLFVWSRFCQNSNNLLCADTFRNPGNEKKIEPRFADGPININKKLSAGDAFGFWKNGRKKEWKKGKKKK